MRDVPVLCPSKGTAAGTCTLPHMDGRMQDATPDFPPCLCGNTPYRRHGNSGTGRGLASVTFSLIYGAYGRLYGGTVAARRPGCAYEDKNLLISEKRGKSL